MLVYIIAVVILLIIISLLMLYVVNSKYYEKFSEDKPVVYDTNPKSWKTNFMPEDLYEAQLKGNYGLAFPH